MYDWLLALCVIVLFAFVWSVFLAMIGVPKPYDFYASLGAGAVVGWFSADIVKLLGF